MVTTEPCVGGSKALVLVVARTCVGDNEAMCWWWWQGPVFVVAVARTCVGGGGKALCRWCKALVLVMARLCVAIWW